MKTIFGLKLETITSYESVTFTIG